MGAAAFNGSLSWDEFLCGQRPWGPWIDGDFTQCFESTILVGATPAAYLVLYSLIALVFRRSWARKQEGYLPISTDRPDSDEEAPAPRPRSTHLDALSWWAAAVLVCAGLADLAIASVRYSSASGAATIAGSALWSVSWIAVAFILKNCASPANGSTPHSLPHLSVLSGFFVIATFAKLVQAHSIILSGGSEALFVSAILSASFALFPLLVEIYHRFAEPEGEAPPSRDVEKEGREPSPESKASFMSRVTYSWLDPLMTLGNKRPLELTDLWNLEDVDTAEASDIAYKAASTKYTSLLARLTYVVRIPLAIQWLSGLTAALAASAAPIFLKQILDCIEAPDKPRSEAAYWVFALFLFSVFRSFSENAVYFNGRKIGIRTRSILIAEVYKKALRRAQVSGGADKKSDDPSSKEDVGASVGKIVTLMSVDVFNSPPFLLLVEKIRQFVSYSSEPFLVTPLRILFATASLIYYLGLPALAPVAVMIASIPIVSAIAAWMEKVQERMMETTDERVTVTSEVLNGIRIIKYFAWEPQFIAKILDARSKELRALINVFITNAVSGLMWSGTPILVAFVTFATYTVWAGKDLDAATAFTALNLLNALRIPLLALPHEIIEFFMARVSLRRLANFLEEKELDKYAEEQDQDLTDSEETDPVVGFEASSLTFYEREEEGAPAEGDVVSGPKFTLRSISTRFPSSGLTVICGATGAGK
ncbi:ABC transporter type 1, transmembrane domain-containing protein, partial [Blyttiomyces helicus]